MKRRATQKIEAQVVQLEQPESMGKAQWRGVKAYLLAIARHYPRAYPSQQTLADELGRDVRSIRNYQRLATEAGFLLVKPDSGKKGRNHTWSRTHQYLILIPATIAGPIPEIFPTNPTGTTYPPGEELRSSHSSSEKSLSAVRISRHDPEGPVRQMKTDPVPPRPKKPRRRPDAGALTRELDGGKRKRKRGEPKSTPWKRTAELFLGEWDAMVINTTPGDYLRSVRPAETRGHFQNYLQATFFGRDAATPKTEAEVADLIAEFMTNVFRGQVRIKEGQSAWMCFTGSWGRRKRRGYHNDTEKVADEYVPPQRRT